MAIKKKVKRLRLRLCISQRGFVELNKSITSFITLFSFSCMQVCLGILARSVASIVA